MPTWLSAIIDAIATAVGGFKGFIVQKVLRVGGQYLWAYILKLIRRKKQDEALKKVDEDVANAKPRTEEVRKNEEDFINS